MRTELAVKLLSKDTINEQLNVYVKAFGNNSDIEVVKSYWEAKHYMNPIHDSYIFGVYDGNLLVSINAYMPMKYSFNGKTVNFLQSCESGTIPEYQGKGLWSKVVKYAVNYFSEERFYDAIIGFPNYRNSYGGFVKMKWEHIGDVGNYIFVINGKSFLNIATGKNIPLSKILEIQKIFLSNKGIEYKILDNEYKNISSSISSSHDIFDLALTEEFMRWKKRYKHINVFSITDKNDAWLGYCLYTITDYKGKETVLLHRIETNEKIEDKILYSVIIKEIIKKHPKAAFIRTWVMPKSERERTIKRIKFLKSRHHNPFIIKQLKENVISKEELHKISNWANITFLDLD